MSQLSEAILEEMSIVVLWSVKACDICKHIDRKPVEDCKPAIVDGPTQPSFRWGYMCHEHFASWGYPEDHLNKRLAYDPLNEDNHNLPVELLGKIVITTPESSTDAAESANETTKADA